MPGSRARAIVRGVRACLSISVLAVVAALGRATASAQEAPSPPDIVPPRAIVLGEVVLDDPAGPSALEVLVLVEPDGRASLAECAHPEPTCAAIERALMASQLAPATREGRAVPARVGMRLTVRRPAVDTPPAVEPPAAAAPPEPPRRARAEPALPRFRARARAPEIPASARRFTSEQIRDVPGAFGDPLRAIESMPGVVPVLSGLPYVFVRGSPPSGTLYAYDGIPLPQLFHLALGPSVVHPRMLGAIQLHSGSAPAQWGRHIGGVILAEGPDDDAPETTRGEIELRLLDVNGYVETPLLGGSFAGAVRVGWPGVVASAIEPSLELFYGDYQLRATIPVNDTDRVQLVALGSYDRFAYTLDVTRSAFDLQFHRLEVRYLRRVANVELLAALRFGYDESRVEQETAVSEVERGQVTPRVIATVRDPLYVLQVGADAVASFGPVDVSLGTTPWRHARVPARSVAGAWIDLSLRPDPAWTIAVGGRLDTWMTGPHLEAAIDPRLRVTWRPTAELSIHAGSGITRQPPAFYVPVPGFDDVALGPGLQTAIQSDVGATFELDWFRAELQLFVHRYENLVFSDFFVLLADNTACDPLLPLCSGVEIEPTTNGLSWGGEVLLSIAPDQPLSGWLSYTLAWAEADPIAGIPFRPAYDVRHVANLVLRWEIGAGFSIGGRVHVRSGAPRGVFWLDLTDPDSALRRHEVELDPFFRADAQIAYAWDAGWGRLRVVLEWLNLTLAEEQTGITCQRVLGGRIGACETQSAPAIFAPNLGLRMEL